MIIRLSLPKAETAGPRARRAPSAGDLAPLHVHQVEDVHVGEEDGGPVLREGQSPEGVDLAAAPGLSSRSVDCRVAAAGAGPERGRAAEAADAHRAVGGHGQEEGVRLDCLGSVSPVEKENL